MKPYVVKARCAAQPDICPPIRECPGGAILFVKDEAEPIGGRIEFDHGKCTGCGRCVEACCSHCIEMRVEE